MAWAWILYEALCISLHANALGKGNICHCLPLDRTWHKVFFIVRGIEGGRDWSGVETHVLLDDTGHGLTRCNVSQVTLLDLDSLDVMWVQQICLLIAWTRPMGLVLFCAVNAVFPPKGGPAKSRGGVWPRIWHWSWSWASVRHKCQTGWCKPLERHQYMCSLDSYC